MITGSSNRTAPGSPLAALAALALLLTGCSTCGENPAATSSPPPDPSATPFNVVLVSVDTMRADRTNTFGYTDRKTTPNLDALAADGIAFENYITACPWTTPAHLSLLTGLHPSTHGMTASFGEMWRGLYHKGEFFKLPDSRTTIAEALSSAGFRTAAFTAGGPLEPSLGFDQGFSSYGTSMYKLYEGNTRNLFDWISRNSKDQFFVFWHHFEVHAPYLNADFVEEVVEGDRGRTVREEIAKIKAIPLSKVWPGGASIQRKKQVKVLKAHETFDRDTCEALYTGGALEADRWLGKLLGVLKARGIYDRTMIVVSSDHGEEFGDHNPKLYYNIHGHILYEEMIHVPLVIKLPRSYGAGTRVSEVVQTVDVMPTILDVLDVEPAKDEMQGRSLAGFWERPKERGPEGVAFTEAMARSSEKKSIRTGRYKYILSIDAETVKEHGRGFLPVDRPLNPELYDLKKDPEERVNLMLHDPGRRIRALAADLEKRLRAHVSSLEGKAEKTNLDEDTIKKLEGLGYIGDDADHPIPTGTPDSGDQVD